MSVTPDDVRHVARLARLGLSEERMPSLVKELNGILGHMEVLQQVTIPGDSLTSRALVTPLRDDALPPDPLQGTRESFAPASRDGFFLVPRLATHGALGASVVEDA